MLARNTETGTPDTHTQNQAATHNHTQHSQLTHPHSHSDTHTHTQHRTIHVSHVSPHMYVIDSHRQLLDMGKGNTHTHTHGGWQAQPHTIAQSQIQTHVCPILEPCLVTCGPPVPQREAATATCTVSLHACTNARMHTLTSGYLSLPESGL